jgi:cation:H+ antiporter
VALAYLAFTGGAAVALATSWLLVIRLERVGERLGLSEALLGVVAALAADAPEITSSVTALASHQRTIGAGVVIGSNSFNLAALLGLGALVAGFITLHRRVVELAGAVAIWIALCCVVVVTRTIPVDAGLAAAGVVFVAYLVVLSRRPAPSRHHSRFRSWLETAVREEEDELLSAIHPLRARRVDVTVAISALVCVVLASVAMERGAVHLGHHFHVADAVVGGTVLAAITSMPNAVAAVYLASRGRGAAALSTALTSNNINVLGGLLIPGAFVGVAASSAAGSLTVLSYLVLTIVVVGLAYAGRGLSRRAGVTIIAGYVIFVVALIAVTSSHAT